MSNEQKQAVAHEIRNAGFMADIVRNGVLVSLKRDNSKIEVQIVLNDIFDGIEFRTVKNSGKVLIS